MDDNILTPSVIIRISGYRRFTLVNCSFCSCGDVNGYRRRRRCLVRIRVWKSMVEGTPKPKNRKTGEGCGGVHTVSLRMLARETEVMLGACTSNLLPVELPSPSTYHSIFDWGKTDGVYAVDAQMTSCIRL